MTPRKELFLAIRETLKELPELELVDLERGQMHSEKFPHLFVSALIRINKIDWETMTEANQEGNATVDVVLYCRDGWMDQHQNTTDPNGGLMEIDLLDGIAEKLQFLYGDQFKPLQQTGDETEEQNMGGMFAYRQTFSTRLYRKLGNHYQTKKVSIK